MTDYSHPLFIKGHYQVVALTSEEQYEPERVFAYAVLNSAGAKLRHELTLDDAKAWVEVLIEKDRFPTSTPPVSIRPNRVRR
ncbi:hypothetical protein [Lysobacter sp. CFH 32150]|uniref:hypothetical protein n=1 Tax=Lysobacter sp. CFH 32150 TaxID=2927128 RepID=UPI001FA7669E|nr:hypothetical protein [Lysobacter sp. CFH 32150]MCI4567370.1 hypothetical protein [Lysobacter sp. CFH 32150]